jgi:HK97 family phage prohead protease
MKDLMKRSGEFEVQERSIQERTITGVITTNAVDRYREIVEPSGAILENFRKNPVVLLNHNSLGIPIGRNQWIKAHGEGLIAKTQFADTAEGHDLFKLYDEGYMKAWSIGFIPKKWEDASLTEAGYRRRYTSWELLEYSAVTVPANPEAITNMLGFLESERLRDYISQSASEINIDARLSELLFTVQEATRRMDTMCEQVATLETALQVREALLIDLPGHNDEHEGHEHNNAAAGDTSHEPTPEPTVRANPDIAPPDIRIQPDDVARIVAEVLGKKLREYNLIM